MDDGQKVSRFFQRMKEAQQDIGELYKAIEDLAVAGEVDALYQICIALEASDVTAIQSWIIIAIFDHIESTLAVTRGIASAETLLKLALVKRERSVHIPIAVRRRNAYLASLLNRVQPLEVLVELIERHLHDDRYMELMSFLAQEMIVSGLVIEDSAIIRRLHEKAVRQCLPIAWLPLALTEIETDLQPSFGSLFSSLYSSKQIDMQHSQTIEHLFVETTTDYEHARIRTAIINWAEESNGIYEARTFEMDQSALQGGAQIPQALVSLPLLCFKHEEVKVNMYEVSLSWAFRSLFQTASHGGAYNNGHKAALGRLEAWISLAGLANAEDGGSIQQVLQAAQRCQWFQFTTDTWFYNCVWDLGMIAIRPDQTSLAVLTATDTD